MTRRTRAATRPVRAGFWPFHAANRSAAPARGGGPARLPREALRTGLLLASGGLLVVLDATITAVAVPAMVTGLRSSLAAVQWVTTGYLIGIVTAIPSAGWLCARYGARRVYVAALLVFTLFSGLAGLAWSAPALAVLRLLQGLGGGLLNPVGQVIAFRSAPPGMRGRLMSLLGLPLFLGPLAGPLLGGWLVELASWRWIFLVNVPLGLAAAAVAARLLPHPDSATPSSSQHPPRKGAGSAPRTDAAPRVAGAARAAAQGAPGLDRVGMLLLPGGAALTVLGCTTAIAALPAGLALLVAFGVRAVRIEHPLVDLRLLRHPALRRGLATLAGFGAAYFGALTVLPIVVQGVRGLPATVSGLLALPGAVVLGATVTVATRLVDRVPARRVVVTGIVAGLAGLAILWAATVTGGPLPLLVLGAAVLAGGSGATLMPAMTVTLRDLPADETPAGTTLMALVQQLASALGVALVTATLGVALDGTGVAAMVASGGRPDLGAAVGWAYVTAVVLMVLGFAAQTTGGRSATTGGTRDDRRPPLPHQAGRLPRDGSRPAGAAGFNP